MNMPGFHAESSLVRNIATYFENIGVGAAASGEILPMEFGGSLGRSTSTHLGTNNEVPSPGGRTIAQRAGCTDCILYTEPGPGGRTAGVRICCTTICKWHFGCVQSCTAELCWTPPAGDIFV